jgi:DNA-binding FadR family transcriptional regulator
MSQPLVKDFERYLLEEQATADGKLESEVELAGRFKVSRSCMREVLTHFQLLGVVERTRNRGSYVRQLAYEKLEDVMSFCFQISGFGFEELKEARLQMEQAILPLIAKRLGPQGAERLRENIESMLKAKDDPELADSLDRDFHIALFELSGNRALKIFANVLHLLFRRQHRTRFLNAAAVIKSAGDHKLLLEALQAEDLDRACALVRKHIMPT